MDRRQFLSRSATLGAATPLAFSGLHRAILAGTDRRTPKGEDFGALVKDPAGLLDLPEGFRYRIVSRHGERMSDGLLVPAAHDGMAAFAGPEGTTILIRNHELGFADLDRGPFGSQNALLKRIDRDRVRDRGMGEGPTLGGTTTVVYDAAQDEVVTQFLSLAGTVRNCAGGPTPWNSWISCEETTFKAGDTYAVDHGYNFEVPATATPGLAEPIPLTAMGRFNHEAVAVDPRTGIVYQTEDRGDSLFYRFVPTEPGRLRAGGRLQALVAEDHAALDTRNWKRAAVAAGESLRVRWVDLDEVESPDDDLRARGRTEHGCAVFARGEGMWWSPAAEGHAPAAFFTCTSGGPNKKGQIWRYLPDRTPDEGDDPASVGGTLELYSEPNDRTALENCDNLTACPWGDLIVCEDGPGEQFLVGVRPDGACYPFARNARTGSEFAGACFSPDGTTLFANVQGLGITLAIRGPWERRTKRD